ncbi:NAD(P)/FAD-dependent oxidoreductase [Halorutilales archaeon Cl-col2-1]
MNRVVVLGAGYGGATVVKRLRSSLDDNDEIVWIDKNDYHLVRHEVHRVIYDPSVDEEIAIPMDEIKKDREKFVESEVEGFEFEEKKVVLEDDEIEYDYLVIALGQRTAFYGIPGMEENAHTLRSLGDGFSIRHELEEIVEEAKEGAEKRVVIGGAGLSGIQTAGEIADVIDDAEVREGEVTVNIIEALDEVMPGPSVDDRLRSHIKRLLRSKGIQTKTGDPITEVTDNEVRLDEGDPIEYDMLIWAGGLTAREFDIDIETEDAERNAFKVDEYLESVDADDVFVIGDAAAVEDTNGNRAPQTAWAAEDEADVCAENILRKIDGDGLKELELNDPGTLVSVGREAVAMVNGNVFGGVAARLLKKTVAARHIASVRGAKRGVKSFFKEL